MHQDSVGRIYRETYYMLTIFLLGNILLTSLIPASILLSTSRGGFIYFLSSLLPVTRSKQSHIRRVSKPQCFTPPTPAPFFFCGSHLSKIIPRQTVSSARICRRHFHYARSADVIRLVLADPKAYCGTLSHDDALLCVCDPTLHGGRCIFGSYKGVIKLHIMGDRFF
ncbi:hypothetical protein CEXT_492791 [Caerostris extrusa]|uniref:Uncharacterized protein n=1 Tax=Caerostris extrusa TaxID=172846 RepID=A0AAV4RY24_CAEEX|nr:hypothetical protein CEXT_492791 [Caerostris extrusa]